VNDETKKQYYYLGVYENFANRFETNCGRIREILYRFLPDICIARFRDRFFVGLHLKTVSLCDFYDQARRHMSKLSVTCGVSEVSSWHNNTMSSVTDTTVVYGHTVSQNFTGDENLPKCSNFRLFLSSYITMWTIIFYVSL